MLYEVILFVKGGVALQGDIARIKGEGGVMHRNVPVY